MPAQLLVTVFPFPIPPTVTYWLSTTSISPNSLLLPVRQLVAHVPVPFPVQQSTPLISGMWLAIHWAACHWPLFVIVLLVMTLGAAEAPDVSKRAPSMRLCVTVLLSQVD